MIGENVQTRHLRQNYTEAITKCQEIHPNAKLIQLQTLESISKHAYLKMLSIPFRIDAKG